MTGRSAGVQRPSPSDKQRELWVAAKHTLVVPIKTKWFCAVGFFLKFLNDHLMLLCIFQNSREEVWA